MSERSTDWDGRGLPPVAAERVRRAAEGGAWTSLLSAPAAAGLEVAGFGGHGRRGDGLDGPAHRLVELLRLWPATQLYGPTPAGRSRQASNPRAGFAPYAARPGHRLGHRDRPDDHRGDHDRSRRHRRRSACPQTSMGNAVHEFTAMGTAVRARLGPPGPGGCSRRICRARTSPSSSLAGWVPAELALGIAVGIRHDDFGRPVEQRHTGHAGNIEVAAHTELVNQTRADARMLLRRRIRRWAPTARSSRPCALSYLGSSPTEGHTDHVAEATVVATAIGRFHRSQVKHRAAL